MVLVVGVNGSGKTTTIGKLAGELGAQGLKVMLAAGDTFRAAAIEQLGVWAERSGAPFIAQQAGADPGAVVFDAMQAARARGCDVLIADTAGRLHNQAQLMDELRKIKRVMARVDPSAPHEVLLVLDANQGQNALAQAEQFNAAIGVTGLVVTKLDGTARGGIVVAIARRLAPAHPLDRHRRAKHRISGSSTPRLTRRRWSMAATAREARPHDHFRCRRQALSRTAARPWSMSACTSRPARWCS